MRNLSIAALVLLISQYHGIPRTHAFVTPISRSRPPLRNAAFVAAIPSPEESAKALSDYMAKSHAEKLRAIKQVEDKKNAELRALKKELEEVKTMAQSGGGSSSSSSMVVSTSKITRTTTPAIGSGGADDETLEELKAKLLSYQQFMTKYIVEAQEQKTRAVAAAEAALAKKYEERLLLLGGGGGVASIPPAASPAGSKLYQDRNARISAAGKAGKSRWGDMEVSKATSSSSASSSSSSSPAAASSSAATIVDVVNGAPAAAVTTTTTNPEVAAAVAAADHGLRADGGVGGLTLAERVAMGKQAPSSGGGASAPPSTANLFQARNERIAREASGTSSSQRWGPMEVAKTTGSGLGLAGYPDYVPPSSLPPVPDVAPPAVAVALDQAEAIEAADHGLRADGGVGGLTLAERVTLGSQAPVVGPASAMIISSVSSAAQLRYYQRNVRVSEAGKAGKSRWGSMEIAKAAELASSPPPVAAAAASSRAVPEEIVQAADHGLRADGGVGGPSLADRVNLGARLLG